MYILLNSVILFELFLVCDEVYVSIDFFACHYPIALVLLAEKYMT